ncbi:MAG: HNH endonuclease [Rubrivivax sp.]|nr:HNH endonuclease [Rubrivivax sp.]MBK7263017.1 HNH endonuclease [Rubrivivax sp.]MBK8529192.1 HNH endonuclease [Rubrivivax sp.]
MSHGAGMAVAGASPGWADGGTDDEGNLQSICDACHTAKTDAENGRVMRQGSPRFGLWGFCCP